MEINKMIQQGIIELKALTGRKEENLVDIISEIKRLKKIAVFFGNCQIEFLENQIYKMSSFKDDYVIIRMPAVHLMGEEEKKHGLNNDLLKAVDLFIYQEVHDVQKYGELITENITRCLSDTCIKLCIPNCFFKGYHPQMIKNERNTMLHPKYNEGGIVPYGDSVLQECFEANMDIDALEMYMYSDDCISKSMINDNLAFTFRELKRREQVCDITISDFIESNYKEKYLFYSPSHPANIVLHELGKRILDKLGYNTKDFIYSENQAENNKFEVLIYPVVKKTLGLSFDKETFYFCSSLCQHRDTLLGYALKYRKYCFPELRINGIGYPPLDMTYNIKIDTNYVEERLSSCMTYINGTVHLALYLTALKEIPNVTIVYIPKEIAPKKTYLTAASGLKASSPVQILSNGEIRLNKTGNMDSIIMIDTMWHV